MLRTTNSYRKCHLESLQYRPEDHLQSVEKFCEEFINALMNVKDGQRKMAKKIVLILMLVFSISSTGFSYNYSPTSAITTNSTATIKTDADDDALRDVISKLADEYSGISSELKNTDSGKAAGNVLKTHGPKIKALTEKGKELDKNKVMAGNEEQVKKFLGEELFNKFVAAFQSVLETIQAVDDKFKDDTDWQASFKEFQEATR